MNKIELLLNKNVVIFGAGTFGRVLLSKLRLYGVMPVAFCDNSKELQGKQIDGIFSMSLSEVGRCFSNTIFVVATSAVATVTAQIEESGYMWILAQQFLKVTDFFEYAIPQKYTLEATWYAQKHYLEREDVFALDSLDFMLTERCSLRCGECSNLMQYYAEPHDFLWGDLYQSMERMLQIYKEIYEVRLLGGEPFMSPMLDDIIDYLGKQSAIKRICIYTNATMVPTEKNLRMMREVGKVWLSISDYGELSRNLTVLKRKLNQYGIPYEVKTITYWTRCSTFDQHGRNSQELAQVYMDCCARNLRTLLNGKCCCSPFLSLPCPRHLPKTAPMFCRITA